MFSVFWLLQTAVAIYIAIWFHVAGSRLSLFKWLVLTALYLKQVSLKAPETSNIVSASFVFRMARHLEADSILLSCGHTLPSLADTTRINATPTNSIIFHGLLTRYVKLRVVHTPEMPGTIFPSLTSKETASYRPRHASRYVRHARAVMYVGIANPRWRGKRSRHSCQARGPLRSVCCRSRGGQNIGVIEIMVMPSIWRANQRSICYFSGGNPYNSHVINMIYAVRLKSSLIQNHKNATKYDKLKCATDVDKLYPNRTHYQQKALEFID